MIGLLDCVANIPFKTEPIGSEEVPTVSLFAKDDSLPGTTRIYASADTPVT